jgi:hypothetical protein
LQNFFDVGHQLLLHARRQAQLTDLTKDLRLVV